MTCEPVQAGFTTGMSTEPLSDPHAASSIAADAHAEPVNNAAHENTASAYLAPEAMAYEASAAPSATLSAPASGTAEAASDGRYTHAQLQAMVGKRGRKPPEFYQAFPRSDESAFGSQSGSKPGSETKKPRAARTRSLPAVSSAVIGEHTIDELLAMIGSTGRKPVAFDILQESAQVFVDAKAIDMPPAPVDPLIADFAAAPKGVREAILALLAATKKR